MNLLIAYFSALKFIFFLVLWDEKSIELYLNKFSIPLCILFCLLFTHYGLALKRLRYMHTKVKIWHSN